MTVEILMFVVYDRPLDYPFDYVVRVWRGMKPDSLPLFVSEDYSLVKTQLERMGLTNIGRETLDDWAIKECWI